MILQLILDTKNHLLQIIIKYNNNPLEGHIEIENIKE